MVNITDYKSYMKQNYNLIELFRETESLALDRLNDLLKVLGFVELLYDQGEEINEELNVIFEVGFSYFHEQFEQLKIYYNNYFKRDLPKFKENELLINYSLYIDDLEEVLQEKNLYDNETHDAFSLLKDEIEEVLLNKNGIIDFERYNEVIEQYVPVGTHTTLEIFAMIVEELGI